MPDLAKIESLAERGLTKEQIAGNLGIHVASHSYVRHALPLGLLAPSIVEAICSGRQPVALTAERLKLYGQLSLEWNTQQQQLSH